MPQYSGIWTEQAVMQAVGAGNWANVPGVPTGVTGTVLGATSVSVAFTAPTFAGIPATITSYTVTSSPGGITASGASSPITVTGLTTGTPYTFTVTATNASGTSSPSAASSSVTPVQIDYIEDVFSTYLYTGNGSTQTINNGINLSTYGGLVWYKARSNIQNNWLVDSSRGTGNALSTNTTNAQSSGFPGSFNTDGFSTAVNSSPFTYASWTFRKQAKFFDIVTYTGNGTTQNIAHNLGSVPGCIIVKEASAAGNDWQVYHRSTTNTCGRLFLNLTNAENANGRANTWGDNTNPVPPTSTVFTVGNTGSVNNNGATFVAYLFAHDAGGFGLTGTDNVISCGSYTGNGSASGPVITLGYEPQWVMVKRTDTTSNWTIFDTMRGMSQTTANLLYPNVSDDEGIGTQGWVVPNATGFQLAITQSSVNASGGTYIYIAIRRGPMKVPTSGTSVFTPLTYTNPGTGTTITSLSFPADVVFTERRDASAHRPVWDRLRGATKAIYTNLTGAEGTVPDGLTNFASNVGYTVVNDNGVDGSQVNYVFRRAPSFFDEVCYTGTGNVGSDATRITHNLGVAPELIIVKGRTNAVGWPTYTATGGVNSLLLVNATDASSAITGIWATTAPTSTTFGVSNGGGTYNNGGGVNYVAYLFATCAGVSKVGSYTGTGALQTINCGFAAGARFVLIKRTDSTGDWWTYDSARGISSSSDPYLYLNSTAAEVTGTNYVDTTSVGFQVTAAAPAGLNASGGTYIFLAIA